jgi:hypothetical protein
MKIALLTPPRLFALSFGVRQEEREAHKGVAAQASAVVAERKELQVEVATARDCLAAEAAAKAELGARVATLEADLAGALTGLEVRAI